MTEISSLRRVSRSAIFVIVLVCLFVSGLDVGLAGAQPVVSASPDITLALGSLVASDEDVAVDNRLGLVLLENLGALPGNADVTAFGLDVDGDRLIAFDTTVSLIGGLVAQRGDVVRFDGASYSTEFDASAAGVPAGAVTDAVSLSPSGLLLSFDTTVDLGGLLAEDADLVRWDGSGFSLALEGQAVGLDSALDIDAAQDLGGGSFLMSFDTSGEIGGVVFADEDVVRFDGASWTLEFDASAADSNWGSADLNAVMVPEPGVAALLGAAVLWLGIMGRRGA